MVVEEPKRHVEAPGTKYLEDVVGEEGRETAVEAAFVEQDAGSYLSNNCQRPKCILQVFDVQLESLWPVILTNPV